MRPVKAVTDHFDHSIMWVVLKDGHSHYTLVKLINGKLVSRKRTSLKRIKAILHWIYK